MNVSPESPLIAIRWVQIFALALLNMAVLISWMAYHHFQPILIHRFHFESLGTFVHIAQALVIVIVPLLAGWVADYYKNEKGGSFAVFAIGISITSMLFMAVAFTISDQTFLSLRIEWLLPLLIILWLISMNIFHSPANSIVEAFARNPALPLIMAVLAISRQLVLSLEPLIVHLTSGIGGTYTFVAGGLLLIVTGLFFGMATRSFSSHTEHHDSSSQNNYPPIILYGLLAGLCHSSLVKFTPALLTSRFGSSSSLFHDHYHLSLLLWIAALAAIPLSFLVKRTGIRSLLLIALCVCFLALVVLVISTSVGISAAAVVVLALSYSAVSITAFPLALQYICERQAIFGTGVFFACFELPQELFSLLLH